MTSQDSELRDLERRKLALEVRELQRSIWQRPGFTLPLLATVLSLGLGHYTGWFDNQRDLLKIERETLRREIAEFEDDKVALTEQLTRLETAQRSLRQENEELAADNARARAELEAARVDARRQEQVLQDTQSQLELLNAEIVGTRAQLQEVLFQAFVSRSNLIDRMLGHANGVVMSEKFALQLTSDPKQKADLEYSIRAGKTEVTRLQAEIAEVESAILATVVLLDKRVPDLAETEVEFDGLAEELYPNRVCSVTRTLSYCEDSAAREVIQVHDLLPETKE